MADMYPAYPHQLDAYTMNDAAAAYYAQSGQYSAGSSPSSPSMPLSGGGMSGVGPHRMHPSISIRKQHQHRYDASGMVVVSDAPTAPRTYATPSLTSKKEVPAFFGRRPHHHGHGSQPSDEEEDELTEEPPAAGATDQEKIEYKRRQNTLAARRSRKRKMMHQQALEETVERLTREKEIWRTRALMLSNLLRSHGITSPDFLE